MLRDESRQDSLVTAALDPVAAREAEPLLSMIIERYRKSSFVNKRRNPLLGSSLEALSRGNPIAVVPYLRPFFDDEMINGFKSWPAGPEYYRGGTLSTLLLDIIVKYKEDGLQLVREVFKGIPTEQEAYLRVQLEATLERLQEKDWYEDQLPEVPEEVRNRLKEYIESLNHTTWYIPPALPERQGEDE